MSAANIIPMVIAVVIVCALLLFLIIHHSRKQDHQVERIRSSDLYGHLYPLLLRCNRRCVESIAIRTTSVQVRLFNPAGRTLLYTFDKHGFDPVPQEYLHALSQAVAMDLPLLRDNTCYTYHTYTETLPNGVRSKWYEYMITTDYKDSLTRADYLKKKPHRV